MSYDIYLPSYSIGADVYDKIYDICRPYGKRAVVVGGHTAMEKALPKIKEAIEDKDIEITDALWYGGDATYAHVDMLAASDAVKSADMIWAVGGGKATDTGKTLADVTGRPIFTFPTIASNCSACTSVSIMYKDDGSFLKPHFFCKPPVHAFIDIDIIAHSPSRYMWAGIGDTYAKYFESTVSSRNEEVPHYIALGTANSRMCYEPMLKYGAKALTDMKHGVFSPEFEQVVLSIIVTTAVASILLTTDHIIDYNTGLAHAIFYALTSYPHIEERHLHGEVVGYGVLVLLLVDGNKEDFDKLYAFNKQIGLPIKLSDIELGKDEIPALVKAALAMKDIEHNPYVITEDMLTEAFNKLEEMNQ